MRFVRSSRRRFLEYRDRIRTDPTWSTRGSAEPDSKKDRLRRSRSFWALFVAFWRLTDPHRGWVALGLVAVLSWLNCQQAASNTSWLAGWVC